MIHLRTATICIVVFLLLCTLTKITECGRGGGGRSSSGGGRSSGGGWGRSSSSSSGKSWGWGWGKSSSSSSSGSSSGSSSSIKLGSSSTSSQHATPSHSSSSTLLTSQHNTRGNYAPSAPSLSSSNNKPAPAPGWNVGNDASIRRDHTQGLNSANINNNKPAPAPGWNVGNQPGAAAHPPPYSSVAHQQGTGAHPPPYPGAPNHHTNGPPPPYPGGANNYPGPPLSGAPPPLYSATHYPTSSHYQSGGQHYSGGVHNYPGMHYQQGGNSYGHYYRGANTGAYPQSNNLPPPPPGYSPYGVPYYQKQSSGISASHVMMGLALWQMTRPSHHHHFYGSSGYENNGNYGYHEFNRQRYTTTYGGQNPSPNAPGTHNTLEMTHYVVPDQEGAYKTVVGNMTCLSLYNAKEVSKWANKTVDDFYKQFPGSQFPLFDTGKNTTNKFENFTMLTGRVIHEEAVSVTCCGTSKGPLELSMLTSGKSPDVNCLHFIGKIPFRKITFVKVQHVQNVNVNMSEWTSINLAEHNLNSTSTPTPLAPFPNTTDSNTTSSSTTPSVDLSQTFNPLGLNGTTLEDIKVENTTFPSLGSINSTTFENNTFSSLGSNNDTVISS